MAGEATAKKAATLRELADSDLRKREMDLAAKLFDLNKKQALGQVDNPAGLKHLKKARARVLTVMRERSLALELSASAEGAGDDRGK